MTIIDYIKLIFGGIFALGFAGMAVYIYIINKRGKIKELKKINQKITENRAKIKEQEVLISEYNEKIRQAQSRLHSIDEKQQQIIKEIKEIASENNDDIANDILAKFTS